MNGDIFEMSRYLHCMNSDKRITQLSKLLSYILRHNPGEAGLKPDEHGWVEVDPLLKYLHEKDKSINFDLLQHIVDTNSKKRFAFNEDFTKIRASQGHSIEIDLQYSPIAPPEYLYHGTVAAFISAITEKGLIKIERHHVHLTADIEVAKQVGGRRGKPVILTINASMMYQQGFLFYLSDNGVWLTDHVLPQYITWP